nr:LacI family DNA-binding transcriptional regulator [Arthrobacter hankyongi]
MGSSLKPTIRDVAEQAGVSLATVSYVLSGRNGGSTRISEPTKERVLQAAQSLGYVANHAARGMRRGRTDTVAVVVENLDSPWDRSLAEAAYRILPGHGYRVVILLGQEAWRNFMLSGGADGAILGFSTGSTEELRTIADLATRGAAQVVVSQTLEPKGFDVVSMGEGGGIAEAAQYLASGHRRIGVIERTGAHARSGPSRLELFRSGLERHGVELDPALVRSSPGSWRTTYTDALELLSGKEPPTAVFATTDLDAVCVGIAAERLGIKVPQELEIIGVGNSDIGQDAEPALSTVGPDPVQDDIVRLLLSRLEARQHGGLENQPGGRHVPAPWKLHFRGTTARGGDAD